MFGGFFGGDPAQVVPRVSLRVGETFNTQIAWERSDINLPGGTFVTNLARLRVNYSFTTRMFGQALVQYNDSADLWSSNIRFAILSDANTDFFIVYNETEGIGAFIPPGAGRSLTLKYSYLFDLLPRPGGHSSGIKQAKRGWCSATVRDALGQPGCTLRLSRRSIG